MLRNQIITEWTNLKAKLSGIKEEYQEHRINLSKLKLARWKTYAKKVYLINGYEGSSLSDTVSRWNQKDYYKIVNNPSGVARKINDNLITKWNLTTIKCLVIEEEQEETLVEEIFNPATFEEIKEKLTGITSKPSAPPKNGEEIKKLTK